MIGQIKVSRSIKELGAKIKEIQREELVKKGKEMEINEIAKMLNVTKEEIVVAIEAIKPLESVDQEKSNNKQNKETIVNSISNKKDETQDLVDRICLKRMISELAIREKQIIILRYFKGKTQTEVSKILGISQVQISRTEKKILEKMKKEIL